MVHTILNTIITFVVSGALGYCVSSIKNYKKQKEENKNKILEEFNQLKENELSDMKSDLSNKFYIYDALPEVEDYLLISFQEKCKRYFDLGGNTYIHQLYDKSFEWKIKQTGYLK